LFVHLQANFSAASEQCRCRVLDQIVSHFGNGGGRYKLIAFAGANHGLNNDVAFQTECGRGRAFNFFQQWHIGSIV